MWMEYLDEILMTSVIAVVGALLAALRGIKERFAVDMAARKKLWDEEMIHIRHSFEELLADHRDIKRDLDAIKTELTEKVEKIMVDHASHERDQAVQLEILRDLKEMARNGK